ncbi:MAG: hypothetical protein ACLT76_00875 [Clostridium fessum]
MEQARELFLEGKKLIEISSFWKSRKGQSEAGKIDMTGTMQRCKRNATLRNGKAVSQETRTLPGTEAVRLRRKTRMQSPRESSKPPFDCLIQREQRLAQAVPEDKQKLLMHADTASDSPGTSYVAPD